MSDDFSGFIDTGEDHEPVEIELTTTHQEGDELVVIDASPKKSKSKLPPQSWKEPEKVTVRIINNDLVDGKYLTQTASGDVFLVPAEFLFNTVKDQEIESRALQGAERPYNWDEEIESMSASPDDIRMALWRMGMISKSDAEKKNLKSVLKQLFVQGILPISKEGQ